MRRIKERLIAPPRLSPAEIGAVQGDVVGGRGRAGPGPGLLQSPAPASRLGPPPPRPGQGPRKRARDLGRARRRVGRELPLESVAPTVWTAFWEQWLRRVAEARFPAHLVPPGRQPGRRRRPGAAPGAGHLPALAGLPHLATGGGDGRRHPGLAPAAPGTGQRFLALGRGAPRDLEPPPSRPWAPRSSARRVRPVRRRALPHHRRDGDGAPPATAPPTPSASPAGPPTASWPTSLPGRPPATTTTGQSGHPGSPHYADPGPALAERHLPLAMDGFQAEGVTRISCPRGGEGPAHDYHQPAARSSVSGDSASCPGGARRPPPAPLRGGQRRQRRPPGVDRDATAWEVERRACWAPTRRPWGASPSERPSIRA